MKIINKAWALGFHDRGMGHGDFGIIAKSGEFVCGPLSKELAEHIITLHNDDLCRRKKNKGKITVKFEMTKDSGGGFCMRRTKR